MIYENLKDKKVLVTGSSSSIGQMKLDQVKHIRSLEKESARLKKLVADLSLDKAVLKEALRGNY
jgi:FlaA1/EpsC-like NDP-sugar epimerase